MAYKRREHDRACRCDQADAGCAALAVQRLSRTRVQELAEEIWTVSTGTIAPVQPILDPRSSRPGASAQATYRRRRHKEREQWRDGRRWRWRSVVVTAAVLGVGLLVGHSMGVWLGWRMALLAGLLVWWRLRFHPSANARFWRRQAATTRDHRAERCRWSATRSELEGRGNRRQPGRHGHPRPAAAVPARWHPATRPPGGAGHPPGGPAAPPRRRPPRVARAAHPVRAGQRPCPGGAPASGLNTGEAGHIPTQRRFAWIVIRRLPSMD
jgi:hypothetical protein